MSAAIALDARITLHKLEVFLMVVDEGGVGRAAEKLFVAQPVVSAHLRSLEERVGAKLLRRSGNQLVLTDAGQAAYDWARDVLTRTQSIEREVAGLADGSRGVAVVASSMTAGSYLLPGILAAFRRERPGAQITLSASDTEHAARAAESGACDFAVVIADEDELAHAALAVDRLADEPIVLVGPGGGAVAPSEIGVDELGSLAFVAAPGGLARQRMIARRIEPLGVADMRVTIELGHAEAMKRAVRESLGVAFLFHSSVAEELRRGELREIRLRDAQLAAPVLLLRRRDKRLTRVQQDLVQAITLGLGRPAAPRPGG